MSATLQARTAPSATLPALPLGSGGRLATGRWGMWCAIWTEIALFAYLFYGYFYLAAQSTGAWPPGGPPKLALATANTAVLLASSGAVAFAERSTQRDRRGRATLALVVALLLGVLFVGVQLVEWSHKPFTPASSAYGSVFFTLTGFHMAHVAAGLLVLAALALWSGLGLFDARRHAALSIGAMYWHFVDVVWLAVYAALYLSPYGR